MGPTRFRFALAYKYARPHTVGNKTHVSLLTAPAILVPVRADQQRRALSTLAVSCNGEIPRNSLVHRRRPRRLGWCCGVQVVHHLQQLRVHGVAGHPLQRGLGGDRQHGLLALPRRVAHHVGAVGVVGPPVGAHALHHRRRRKVLLRDGRLRVREAGVRGRRRRAARHVGRVHDGRQRRHGLLRREPGGRVQPAPAGGAAGGRAGRGRQLRADRVRGGPERRVPRRPARGERRRVQERVRGVRVAAVLLQRRVRQPGHVQAVGVLAVLQERVPEGVQLRLRRRHVHVHLRRRRHRIRRHLLPQHHQREVGRVVVDPAGPAADERHRHGVPRRRPARGRHRRCAAAVPSRPLRRRVPRSRRRLALIC